MPLLEVDDERHTFFVCPRWAKIRSETATYLGQGVNEGNIIMHVVSDKQKWDKMAECIKSIMKKKEREEKIIFLK